MTRAAAILAAIAALTLPAAAHQAPSGFAYDASCCSGQDCAPVPNDAIREAPGGYAVRIRPGSHPFVPEGSSPLEAFVPHGDSRIRPSGDGGKHACVSPSRYVLCVYLPPSGF